MPSLDEILKKIQDIFFVKNRLRTRDDFADVPFMDDDDYVTHRRLGEKEEKDEEEEKKPPAPGEVPPEEVPEEEPAPEEEIPAEEPVPGEEGVPGEMGAIGEPEEEPMTPSEIGRVYELKKIYSRLVSVESHLSSSSDVVLLKLRDYVSRAINLFETLASNLDAFKEELDKIIVMFYEFLETVYALLKKYYEIKRGKDEEVE